LLCSNDIDPIGAIGVFARKLLVSGVFDYPADEQSATEKSPMMTGL
jgi:hypothetical protein